MPDALAACVNGNATAEALEEFASIKRDIAADRAQLDIGPTRWAERLLRWADIDAAAARRLRELVAEIERLRRIAGE